MASDVGVYSLPMSRSWLLGINELIKISFL